MKGLLVHLLLINSLLSFGQNTLFNIRTITAGVEMETIDDLDMLKEAIAFLETAKNKYEKEGYVVQTLRLSTQNYYEFLNRKDYEKAIKSLLKIDQLLAEKNTIIAFGSLLPPNTYDKDLSKWLEKVISQTKNLNFSLEIASKELGIYEPNIKVAGEITIALAKKNNGEDNFKFTATAKCPPGIPFFPAASHRGVKSFALGFESPNLLRAVFEKSHWANAEENLKRAMEMQFKPLEEIAVNLALENKWKYDGIDSSPAPGLDASIGEAIEALTRRPFGESSTLRACALITGVLKNLDLKTCGYSGLMLPVIEDRVLSKRADEGKFTVQELMLYSAVSGTGLDVIPLPGNLSLETIIGLYSDIAALSLKYEKKALSARLFLIPGKVVGDLVEFNNPYLTPTRVMSVE